MELGPGGGTFSGLHMEVFYSLTLQNQIISLVSVQMRVQCHPIQQGLTLTASLPP